jgi:hypothetical protein
LPFKCNLQRYITGQIIPLLYAMYLTLLGYALYRQDKGILRNLPHFLWFGTVLLILLFLHHYRFWVKAGLYKVNAVDP